MSFAGHTVADAKEVLDKLSYTSEKDGDLPIDSKYLPHEISIDSNKMTALEDKLWSLLTFANCTKLRHAVQHNIAVSIKDEFNLTQNSVSLIARDEFVRAFFSAGGTVATPVKISYFSGNICNLLISLSKSETSLLDFVCLVNRPVPATARVYM